MIEMTSRSVLEGAHVCLSAEEPEEMAKLFAKWTNDTEYDRLLDSDPQRLWTERKWKEWLEKDVDKDPPESYFFAIQMKEERRSIGFIGLWKPTWNSGDTWVSVGIGEREYWGKGYGTEAMRLMLGYGFRELNLRRITLGVYGYNVRAIQSYLKAGFRVEGATRDLLRREGRYWDGLVMGILREEWEAPE